MGYLLVLSEGPGDGLTGTYERPGLEFVVSQLISALTEFEVFGGVTGQECGIIFLSFL